MEPGLVVFERKDPRFDDAWARLIGKGHDPVQFMYMFSDDQFHHFKHSVTRKYVKIDRQ
jgi:hypothetical protein